MKKFNTSLYADTHVIPYVHAVIAVRVPLQRVCYPCSFCFPVPPDRPGLGSVHQQPGICGAGAEGARAPPLCAGHCPHCSWQCHPGRLWQQKQPQLQCGTASCTVPAGQHGSLHDAGLRRR